MPLFLGDLIGATLGLLLVANFFRLIAGVRFSHWRHIVAAYLAGFFAVVPYAMASGDPLELKVLAYAAGAIIGATMELLYLSRRGRIEGGA